MSDSTLRDAYLAAHQDYTEADHRVQQLVNVVKHAGRLLVNWQDVTVNGFPFPPGMTSSLQRIDPAEWPTGQQLGEALSRWHKAKAALQEAYAKLPDHLHSSVAPMPRW
jgi:hypothetical protein